jgi:hypothetical protein
MAMREVGKQLGLLVVALAPWAVLFGVIALPVVLVIRRKRWLR